MPFQSGSNNYALSVGTNPQHLLHVDVRPPATTDIRGESGPYLVGTEWIDTIGNAAYFLTSYSTSGNTTTANWALAGTDTGALNTLTGGTGGAISPSAGNITLAGTSNQIATTGSGSTITFSLIGPYTPATYTAHGVLLGEGTSSIVATAAGATHSVLQGTTGSDPAFTATPTLTTLTTTGLITAGAAITATTGNITATNGNVVLGTAGNKLNSTSVASTTAAGANSFGTVALVGGTATVLTSAVTANSMIFLTCQALGTVVAPSALCVSATTPTTSFVITASQGTDTSTIAWFIVN